MVIVSAIAFTNSCTIDRVLVIHNNDKNQHYLFDYVARQSSVVIVIFLEPMILYC